MPRAAANAKNIALNALDESIVGGLTHASAHTAYSATGANEVAGGSPAYARKAATWGAAASGAKATTASLVFDIPAGTTVRWIGFWDALAAGNFQGMVPNGGGTYEVFTVNAAGVTSNTLDAPAHGFSANDSVVVWSVPGASLPTGLAEGTVYFVVATPNTDDLQLSATAGGAAIDLTATGSGFLQAIKEQTFATQGTLTVTTATWTLD